MKIKTIDINCLEWFDKINGNSYLAGTITVNFGMKTSKQFNLKFQYGYGDHYINAAHELLVNKKVVPELKHNNGIRYPLWRYCRENNVILRKSIHRNCLKRELLRIGV